MGEHLVYTIGRQCGSMGRIIGQKLAEEIGVKCYDNELLTEAAKNSGLCEELFQTHDEKPTNSFLYSLVMDTYSLGYNTSAYMDMPINHKIFLAQFDTIKKLASEESCVIIGRAADYVLKGNPGVVSVFVHASREYCVKQAIERRAFTGKDVEKFVEKTDKYRSDFYRYYTGQEWTDARNYDLCLNSERLGFDGTMEAIKAYIKVRFGTVQIG